VTEGGAAAKAYRLVPGTEWVAVDDSSAIFRSLRSQATLSGEAVGAFVAAVVPLLDGRHSLRELAAASVEVPIEALLAHLKALADAGLIEPDVGGQSGDYLAPLVSHLATEGRAPEQLRNRLSGQRVAVFGLESAGAQLAREFARWGVRQLLLADPSPHQPDDPADLAGDPTASRQALLAAELRHRHPALDVQTPVAAWSAAAVEAAVADVDVAIAAADREFAVLAQWVNKAAVAQRKVAAFCTLEGDSAWIGPIVFPDETACYMCYRMRAIACEDDYAAAMAFEERRDKDRSPRGPREPTLMPLASVAAGMLAMELAKTFTAAGRHAAAGRVLEWNGLRGEPGAHTILRQPACPVCAKKKAPIPTWI